MKKLILMTLCLVLLTACNDDDGNGPDTSAGTTQSESGTSDNEKAEGKAEDYLPFTPNTLYEYTGTEGVAVASYSFYYEYTDEKHAQRLITAGNEVTSTELLKYEDDAVKFYFGDPSYHFYDNIIETDAGIDIPLIKEPLKVGNTWEVPSYGESEITAVNMPIETPAGNFDCIEITTTTIAGGVEKYYYAKDVGLVKSVYMSADEGEVTSTLSKITKDTDMPLPLEFYSPNATTNHADVEMREISFKTNGDFVDNFNEEFKKVTIEGNTPLMNENTTINSIDTDYINQKVVIDFSKEFVEGNNFGDGVQTLVLQCIADTLGNFYRVAQVEITVDGKPFESGSIKYEEGQTIEVNAPTAEEAKELEAKAAEEEALEEPVIITVSPPTDDASEDVPAVEIPTVE